MNAQFVTMSSAALQLKHISFNFYLHDLRHQTVLKEEERSEHDL